MCMRIRVRIPAELSHVCQFEPCFYVYTGSYAWATPLQNLIPPMYPIYPITVYPHVSSELLQSLRKMMHKQTE